MFEAPSIISRINDIKQIYAINDRQGEELDGAVETLDNNIFLTDMNEAQIKRWEDMLSIVPSTEDDIEDRRFRVMSVVLDRLPYSYRVVMAKLDALCPDGYTAELNDERDELTVKLLPASASKLASVETALERMLPLNMLYEVSFTDSGSVSVTIYQGVAIINQMEYAPTIMEV